MSDTWRELEAWAELILERIESAEVGALGMMNCPCQPIQPEMVGARMKNAMDPTDRDPGLYWQPQEGGSYQRPNVASSTHSRSLRHADKVREYRIRSPNLHFGILDSSPSNAVIAGVDSYAPMAGKAGIGGTSKWRREA